jgi:hypothetical protein
MESRQEEDIHRKEGDMDGDIHWAMGDMVGIGEREEWGEITPL